MSKFTVAELEAKVKRVRTIREQTRKLKVEEEALLAELKAVAIGKPVNAGMFVFEFTERVNWQSFDKGRAMKEYPIGDFPQIYTPDYKSTKELLAQLEPEAKNPIADFCGVSVAFSSNVRTGTAGSTRVGGTPVRRTPRKK